MDVQPAQQPLSDDQDLAKALAGISEDAEEQEVAPAIPTPVAPGLPPVPEPPVVPDPTSPAAVDPLELSAASDAAAASAGDDSLEGIKKEALGELRPLVDKLNVSPEEKFDTYLLLIRSTDDNTLVAPAHEAAKAIPDETRRAQALLDIIKEIDFLSNPQPAQAE